MECGCSDWCAGQYNLKQLLYGWSLRFITGDDGMSRYTTPRGVPTSQGISPPHHANQNLANPGNEGWISHGASVVDSDTTNEPDQIHFHQGKGCLKISSTVNYEKISRWKFNFPHEFSPIPKTHIYISHALYRSILDVNGKFTLISQLYAIIYNVKLYFISHGHSNNVFVMDVYSLIYWDLINCLDSCFHVKSDWLRFITDPVNLPDFCVWLLIGLASSTYTQGKIHIYYDH